MNIIELKNRAKEGDYQALYELGMRYMTGDTEIKKNRAVGIKYLEDAASAHSYKAIVYLFEYYGCFSENCDGKYDPEKSLYYYKLLRNTYKVDKAILEKLQNDLDDPKCLYELGLRYLEGNKATKKDKTTGLKYVNSAADLNYHDAIVFLAKYYDSDLPYPYNGYYDPTEALRYYKKLKDLGEEVDDEILERLEKGARDQVLYHVETAAEKRERREWEKQEIIAENDKYLLIAFLVRLGAICAIILSVIFFFRYDSWSIRIPLIILAVVSVIVYLIGLFIGLACACTYPDQP